MKLPENILSRVLLAYLPFMVYSYDLFRTGIAALWIALFLWVTVTFFWLTRSFFPCRTLKPAFFLWLIVWAQAVWTLTKLPPYWVMSVFFLAPVSFLEAAAKPAHVRLLSKNVPRFFFERTVAGAGFAVFATLLALVRDVGEKSSGIKLFENPAGMLFAAAGIAFCWKNQPFSSLRKRADRTDLNNPIRSKTCIS